MNLPLHPCEPAFSHAEHDAALLQSLLLGREHR